MKIKVVIFDLDGVVFDSWLKTIEIAKKLLRKFGRDFNEEELARIWSRSGHGWMQALFPGLSMETVARSWVEEELKTRIEFCEGTDYVLWWLKLWGFKTGVMTNRRSGRLLAKVFEDNRLDLPKAFDFIQTMRVRSRERGLGVYNNRGLHPLHFFSSFPKPHPRSFKIINWYLKKQGLGKENVLYIGDTVGADLTLARNVGIEFLGVMTGPVDTKEKWREWGGLEEKRVLRSLIELPRWLSKRQMDDLAKGQ